MEMLRLRNFAIQIALLLIILYIYSYLCTAESIHDLEISSDTEISDQIFNVYGNLTISNNSNVRFNNVSIIFHINNSSSHNLTTEIGTGIELQNSSITTANSGGFISINFNGKASINNSSIMNVSGTIQKGGIISTNKLFIKDSKILNGKYHGIFLINSTAEIIETTIKNITGEYPNPYTYNIFSERSNVIIDNSHFFPSTFGVAMIESNFTISNTEFLSSSILCLSDSMCTINSNSFIGSPDSNNNGIDIVYENNKLIITNNIFEHSGIEFYKDAISSYALIKNNSFINCTTAIVPSNSCIIDNNMLNHNEYGIIIKSDFQGKVVNNTLINNSWNFGVFGDYNISIEEILKSNFHYQGSKSIGILDQGWDDLFWHFRCYNNKSIPLLDVNITMVDNENSIRASAIQDDRGLIKQIQINNNDNSSRVKYPIQKVYYNSSTTVYIPYRFKFIHMDLKRSLPLVSSFNTEINYSVQKNLQSLFVISNFILDGRVIIDLPDISFENVTWNEVSVDGNEYYSFSITIKNDGYSDIETCEIRLRNSQYNTNYTTSLIPSQSNITIKLNLKFSDSDLFTIILDEYFKVSETNERNNIFSGYIKIESNSNPTYPIVISLTALLTTIIILVTYIWKRKNSKKHN